MQDKECLDLIESLRLNIWVAGWSEGVGLARGVGAVAPDGRDFWGEDLRACLREVAIYYGKTSPTPQPDDAKGQKFNQFQIGQLIEVLPKKTPQIISYGGMVEGFPEEIVGKMGAITNFDTLTRSQKTVLVNVEGKEYWGSHLEICAPKLSGKAF